MKFSWGGSFLFFELGLKRSISQNKKNVRNWLIVQQKNYKYIRFLRFHCLHTTLSNHC